MSQRGALRQAAERSKADASVLVGRFQPELVNDSGLLGGTLSHAEAGVYAGEFDMQSRLTRVRSNALFKNGARLLEFPLGDQAAAETRLRLDCSRRCICRRPVMFSRGRVIT